MTNFVNESYLFLWVKLQLRLTQHRHEIRLYIIKNDFTFIETIASLSTIFLLVLDHCQPFFLV